MIVLEREAARAGHVLQHLGQPQEDAVGDQRVHEEARRTAARRGRWRSSRPNVVWPTACRRACSSAIVRASHVAIVRRQPGRALRPIGQHDAAPARRAPPPAALRPGTATASPGARAGRRAAAALPRPAPPTITATGAAIMNSAPVRARSLRRDPVGQIQHHAREEACLGDAQQHARGHERPHVGDEHRRHRDQAPADHDPRDPAPRADPLENQVAGNLEQAVGRGRTGRRRTRTAVWLSPRSRCSSVAAKPMLTRSM